MGDLYFVWYSFVAGLLASVACGFGAIPLFFKKLDVKENIGIGYSFAGGLMFAASVYNLLLPALSLGEANALKLIPVVKTLIGLLLGAVFTAFVQKWLKSKDESDSLINSLGGKTGALILIAMTFHSIPEGVAVGVGFASEVHNAAYHDLGYYIALAISIHNIPEGLAVALPLRASGASIFKCFFFAFLTSLPQAIAAVPASLLVWLFEPLMIPFFGFAAGAMIYLVVVELIPEGLEHNSRETIASMFMFGFSLMILVQVIL
ncbi:MAG: ZIP family metal transporter [Bdellovibrionales bacterium]|nr:ZIP family metal transporter [Bdellovibrionales bacterium]